MTKFHKNPGLSAKEIEELLLDFSITLSEIKNPQEAVVFLRDLLSGQEATMLAKRLKIAQLLLEGLTYAEISEELGASMATIARISEWLNLGGEGYRLLIERLVERKKKIQPTKKEFEEPDLRKRYPLYFWPELLFESINVASNRKKKEEIIKTLKSFKDKKELYHHLEKILKQSQ